MAVKTEPQVMKWGPGDNPPPLDGNARSFIPGEVDSPVGSPGKDLDQPSFIPSQVDSGAVAPKVDKGVFGR